MVLAALLSIAAVAPMLADASGLSRTSFTTVPHRAVAAAIPKGTYMLGGITSQGDPVIAAVMHRAASVDLRIALEMKCTSGQPVFLDRTFPLPVKPSGAIPGYNLALPPSKDTGILGGSDVFKGQMNAARSRLTGHWRLKIVVQNSDGSTGSCDSGAVSFTAS
jgi:hypothetical protein